MSSVQGRSPPSWVVFHCDRPAWAGRPRRLRFFQARRVDRAALTCRPVGSVSGSGGGWGKDVCPLACSFPRATTKKYRTLGGLHNRNSLSPSWRPEVQNRGVGRGGSRPLSLACRGHLHVHVVFSPHSGLGPDFPFLCGRWPYWISAHPHDLILI